MRILLLTQWFDPEPTFKGLPFAKELANLGHQVQVLTGFPNYPGGRLYDGYRVRWFQRETMDGIPVVRVPLYPSHDRSSLRRVMNYATFAGAAATIGACAIEPADVAYVYHPPGTIGLPALALKLFRRIPFVYDVQDLWPDTLGATGMLNNRAALWLVNKWCQLTYRQARKIAVLSPGFKETLIRRGIPESKIEVIYNWCVESQVTTSAPEPGVLQQLGMAGRFNVVFAGTMGKAQGLDSVLDAAQLIGPVHPAIQLVFVGAGVEMEHLQRRVAEMRLTNVRFLPRRSPAEMAPIYAGSDALLVHLKNDPLFSITIPSKTQAYLAAGRPILMAVRGDAANLVERAGAGVTCEPENPHALADAIERLYAMDRSVREEMGRRGRDFYWRELSAKIGVSRFAKLLEAAAKR